MSACGQGREVGTHADHLTMEGGYASKSGP